MGATALFYLMIVVNGNVGVSAAFTPQPMDGPACAAAAHEASTSFNTEVDQNPVMFVDCVPANDAGAMLLKKAHDNN